MCQYSGIIQPVVAAIAVAAPFDVVKAELYDQLRAEGIWGRGNELTSDEEAEVKWVMIMMIWFTKKIMRFADCRRRTRYTCSKGCFRAD